MINRAPDQLSVAERIALLPKAERERVFAALTGDEAQRLYFDWAYWARPSRRSRRRRPPCSPQRSRAGSGIRPTSSRR